MPIRTDSEYARRLDEQDELSRFRNRFVFDDPTLIYLDGNSLGRLPTATEACCANLVREQWGSRLIRGWNEHWMELPARLGAKLAHLIGANDDEVIIADSTSINLFKLALAALLASPHRSKVIADDLNFPSDLYILRSVVASAGPPRQLEILHSPDGLTMPEELLASAIDATTALVVLSHVAFRSGFMYALDRVTAMAQQAGARVIWDLSHSVGVVPVSLASSGVDMALGCTYKYLNGGPGSPAFLYIRRELHEALANPIAGWFGRRDQFAFALDYEPAPGVRRFLTGTPPMLSLAAIEPGIDLVLEAGIERLRDKSVSQTEYLIDLWDLQLRLLGFALQTPRDAACRGSHVALGHPEGFRIAQAMVDRMRTVPDFRAPGTIRLGVAPLYTTYAEIHAAMTGLQTVVSQRLYEHYPAARHGVT